MPAAPAHRVEDQSAVEAFLAEPANHGPGIIRVERIDTHGSIVFLAGDRVIKIKRAVLYPYMDYSTLARRKWAVEREVALNRRTAPALYLGAQPITREPDGSLALGGAGEPVEWAVIMRRVAEGDLLDRRLDAGQADPQTFVALGDVLAAFHRAAEPVMPGEEHGGGTAPFVWVIDDNAAGLAEHETLFAPTEVKALQERARATLGRVGGLLDARLASGFVRHCHGDLHLGNICLFEGRPTLFDAIEFNPRFALIDVFYDLAFPLMELDGRGFRPFSNLLLNRYLARTRDLEGLAALPLFLSIRAAIRAKTGAAAARSQTETGKAAALREAAKRYGAIACAYLTPVAPRLIAIGGLSGSGKSTLGRALAPRFGPTPGALHLRSDVLRKLLQGAEPETRLPAEAYRPEVSAAVYARLNEDAARALDAGHAVVVDAVFGRPAERAAIEAVARDKQVPFDGLWLEAPEAVMAARIEARRGDASDATAAVLAEQSKYDPGPITWRRLTTRETPEWVAARAAAVLSIAR